MDLEFREATTKEYDFVVEMNRKQCEDGKVVTHSHDATKGQTRLLLELWVGILFSSGILSALLKRKESAVYNLIAKGLFLLILVMLFVFVLTVFKTNKNPAKNEYHSITPEEIENRIKNAKLYLANVTLVKRELIKTGEQEACYIELIDKNKIMGQSINMHVPRKIYDEFEEGKDAYVVWWDYANGYVGADSYEIMFMNDI